MKSYSFKSFFDQMKRSGVQLKHSEIYLTNNYFLIKKSILKKPHFNFIQKQNKPQEDLSKISNIIIQIEKEKNLIEFIPTHHAEESVFVMKTNELMFGLDEDYYNFFNSLKCKVFITGTIFNPMAIYNKDNEFVGLVMPFNPKKINIDSLVPIEEYKQTFQEELLLKKEKQNKYKRLPVVAYSGIKRKLAYMYKNINGINFWVLKEDEQKNEWKSVLYLHNDHLFYIGSLQGVEKFANNPENREVFNNNFKNFQNNIVTEFELSLEKAIVGECNNIHTGYAEFLSRYDEAKKTADKYNNIKEEKEKIKSEEKMKKEEEQKQKDLQKLMEAEKEFKDGKNIKADIFVELCKIYYVKLPIKVKGWINKSLCSISKDSYRYIGNRSTTITNYASMLHDAIIENEQDNVITGDELALLSEK